MSLRRRKRSRSPVQQARDRFVNLLLIEVDDPLFICGNLPGVKQMFLEVGHDLLPGPDALTAQARSLAPDLSVPRGIHAIMRLMTTWQDFEQAAPEFAQRVRRLFDAHRHKTIATVRADGGPRISGIEAAFEDGELVFGSMTNARKGADLRRDPRFALHSATVDPIEAAEAQWPGEAKISGLALPAGPATGGPEGDSFHADIAEVVHTHLNEKATMLVVEWWTPVRGLRRIERE